MKVYEKSETACTFFGVSVEFVRLSVQENGDVESRPNQEDIMSRCRANLLWWMRTNTCYILAVLNQCYIYDFLPTGLLRSARRERENPGCVQGNVSVFVAL